MSTGASDPGNMGPQSQTMATVGYGVSLTIPSELSLEHLTGSQNLQAQGPPLTGAFVLDRLLGV